MRAISSASPATTEANGNRSRGWQAGALCCRKAHGGSRKVHRRGRHTRVRRCVALTCRGTSVSRPRRSAERCPATLGSANGARAPGHRRASRRDRRELTARASATRAACEAATRPRMGHTRSSAVVGMDAAIRSTCRSQSSSMSSPIAPCCNRSVELEPRIAFHHRQPTHPEEYASTRAPESPPRRRDPPDSS